MLINSVAIQGNTPEFDNYLREFENQQYGSHYQEQFLDIVEVLLHQTSLFLNSARCTRY